MSHRAFSPIIFALAFAFTLLPCLSAQVSQPSDSHSGFASSLSSGVNTTVNSTGSITGSVGTLDGRPIRDARVELKDLNTGATLLSSFSKANGTFELYNIQPGPYDVVATSGLSESRERVNVMPGVAFVNLQLSGPVSDPSGGNAVSVASMKVPNKARKEFEKAQKAFYDNKLDEAKEHVGKALDAYPNYAQALTLRGILLLNDQKTAEGEADLQNALKYDSTYSLAYFAMGAALNQTGKYDDALRTLQRGISYSPDSWQAYFEMAKAHLGKGDFVSALKNVNRAATLVKGDYPPLHLVKAHALLGLKQYDVAIKELEGYLFREPNGAAAASARKALETAKAFVSSGTATSQAVLAGSSQ